MDGSHLLRAANVLLKPLYQSLYRDDVNFVGSCISSVTGLEVNFGCAPRPATFDGLGIEGTNDRDGDGIPDVCDNCPDVPNRDQGRAVRSYGAHGLRCRTSPTPTG